MTDVFVSYARSTEPQAKLIAETLRSQGYSVWRDDELPAHRPYGDVIEERLRTAKAVIAVWSAEAAKSQWVRAEADAAREAGTLVQVSVDGTLPPMPFNQIQCADLRDWNGDADASGWRKIEGSVAALVHGSGAAEREGPAAAMRARRQAICVLPFVNMSGDAEQEYFSDGISEDITTDLSKVSALSVVARNTAFTFKGQSVDVCDIARKLGVSHVLEGSVRKAGGRVRITAQLIDGASGDHIWAERYDRDLTDIFAIQDEISKAIVEALKVKLLPAEKKAIEDRGTTSVEAYNLYLMARQYWITGNHGDQSREDRVIRICQRAVEIDPNYARAWALLAIAQSNLRYGFGQRGDDGVAAAQRALSIDPSIAEAYCVTARSRLEESEFGEALAELRKGLSLDADSWELNKASGFLFLKQGKIPEAAAHYAKAAAVMETDFHAWGMLLTCYESLRDPSVEKAARRCLAECERVLGNDPSNGAAISFVVASLVALKEIERAKEWIERALLIDPDNRNMRYNFACALSVAGDCEAALDMLDSALRGARGSLGLAEVDPDFDNIRDDPRYHAIIKAAKARIAEAQSDAAKPLNLPAASAELPHS